MQELHEFILVRHGETQSNQEGRFQGSHDSPLTERGLAETRRLGRYFQRNLPPVDFWLVSPQGRARTTSQLIRAEMNGTLPAEEVHDDLCEIRCGSFEKHLHTEVDQVVLERIRREPDFPYPGGESKVDVAARAAGFLARFRERVGAQARARRLRTLIVSHGNFNQCMASVLMDVDPLLTARSLLVNTSITRLIARDFDAPFLLRSWGETPHLEGWR